MTQNSGCLFFAPEVLASEENQVDINGCRQIWFFASCRARTARIRAQFQSSKCEEITAECLGYQSDFHVHDKNDSLIYQQILYAHPWKSTCTFRTIASKHHAQYSKNTPKYIAMVPTKEEYSIPYSICSISPASHPQEQDTLIDPTCPAANVWHLAVHGLSEAPLVLPIEIERHDAVAAVHDRAGGPAQLGTPLMTSRSW